MLWERQVDSWHYEFQREGDEIKYLRKMEGSNAATWNYVKWLHHRTFIDTKTNMLVRVYRLIQFFCNLLCQGKVFKIFLN